MRTKILLTIASILSTGAFLHGQVTFLENLLPSSTPQPSVHQGCEVIIDDDLMLVGGENADLYRRCGLDWSLETTFAPVAYEVALGTGYLAYGGAIGEVNIHQRAPGYPIVTQMYGLPIPSTLLNAGNDNLLTIAFAGNDLVIFTGSGIRVYPSTPSFNVSNFIDLPLPGTGIGWGNIAADDDEIAAISGAGEPVIYKKVGVNWTAPTITVLPTLINAPFMRVNGLAMHDDRLVVGGGVSGGLGRVAVYDKVGTWNLTPTCDFVVGANGDPICTEGMRVAFTGDLVFVSDCAGSSGWDDVVSVYDVSAGCALVQVINDDIGQNAGPGAFGLDAKDGFVAIGDPNYNLLPGSLGAVNTYATCPPDGTPCDTDCNANTPEVWMSCSCDPVPTECVEVVIQFGNVPTATTWQITGPSNFTGTGTAAQANLDVTFTYQLLPGNYEFQVNGPNAGVRGWYLEECSTGLRILDNENAWSPFNSLSGPGVTQSGVNVPDFQVPLGPAVLTSPDGILPSPTNFMRWSPNCPGGNAAVTLVTSASPVRFDIFDPDGQAMAQSAQTTLCTYTYVNTHRQVWTLTGAYDVSGMTSARVKRGVWLNARARLTNANGSQNTSNFGPVQVVCFNSSDNPCPPPPVQFAGPGGKALLVDAEETGVFPNPSVDGRATVVVEHAGDLDRAAIVTVFDQTGRVVPAHVQRHAQEGLARFDLDAGELATGVYLIRVELDGEPQVLRWVVGR
jgi:hypothetical protein